MRSNVLGVNDGVWKMPRVTISLRADWKQEDVLLWAEDVVAPGVGSVGKSFAVSIWMRWQGKKRRTQRRAMMQSVVGRNRDSHNLSIVLVDIIRIVENDFLFSRGSFHVCAMAEIAHASCPIYHSLSKVLYSSKVRQQEYGWEGWEHVPFLQGFFCSECCVYDMSQTTLRIQKKQLWRQGSTPGC